MKKPIHLSIPAELYNTINTVVVKDSMYRSVPEFVLECTRNRLYELKQQKIERQKLNIHFREQMQKSRDQAPAQSVSHKDYVL